MVTVQPTITLNNGVALPAPGFGVFQTPPAATQVTVEEVSQCGHDQTLQLAAIDALDTGVRGGPDQDAIDVRTFKREIPEA